MILLGVQFQTSHIEKLQEKHQSQSKQLPFIIQRTADLEMDKELNESRTKADAIVHRSRFYLVDNILHNTKHGR